MALVLIITLIILMILGVPIAFALGMSAMAGLKYEGGSSLIAIIQSLFASLDSFPIMAVPFFMLAGDLMMETGISGTLVGLAKAIVGKIKGGLGAVSTLTAMLFSTLSGSSTATTASIGSIMIPAMIEEKYDRGFAASIQSCSGELGVIIPPSIPMVVYGIAATVSIGDLFLAGFVPGILIGCSLILLIYLVSKKKNYGSCIEMSFKEKIRMFIHAIPALIMPIIILGGIYGGIFTPTEAACVAVVYAFCIGMINKKLKINRIIDIFGKAGITMSTILIIIANASGFAWGVTLAQIPTKVAEILTAVTTSPIIFLILVNIFMLFVGMFMEAIAAILIIAPVLAPVAIQFGIDPVHFGLIMIVNLAVGMCTPPVGVNLFISCSIAEIRLDQIIKPLLMFLGVLIFDLMVITYLPQISIGVLNLIR